MREHGVRIECGDGRQVDGSAVWVQQRVACAVLVWTAGQTTCGLPSVGIDRARSCSLVRMRRGR